MVHHPLFDIGLAERAHLRTLPPDGAIAVAAATRDGVLTHAQLVAIGVSKAAISRRLTRLLLFARHPGVYAVGRYDLTRRGRLRAGLLHCGRTAALGHGTAATQVDLLAARARIHITVTDRRPRPPRGSGIVLHHTRRWLPGEVVWVDGLPCTSVARTLADLAGERSTRDFSRVWNGADRQLLLDVGALTAQVLRERAGAGLMRARLEHYETAPPTESELEDLFLELCAANGIPAPVCQWPLRHEDRTGRVDFVWPDPGVAVEVDGRKWHAIQAKYEQDRERDLALRDAGLDPHRYGWWQVRDQGPRVAAAVKRALAARRRS